MSSYLIVHCDPQGVRPDVFVRPPFLDFDGAQVLLDWGDVTIEVPPGDHRVAVAVDIVGGGREGAMLTVRVMPNTGTRVSFAPPPVPGYASMLRVDGQWPADAAMAYYAARSGRALPGAMQPEGVQQTGPVQPLQQPVQQQPVQQQPVQQQPVQHVPGFGQPTGPQPTVPAVGPTIGSQGSVPPAAPSTASSPSFGQVQGAVVVPGGQPPAQTQADAYGRTRALGDRSAPEIPTPSQFREFAGRQQPQAQPVQQQQQGAQPGWFPDPSGRAQFRWFDGRQWTTTVRDGQQQYTAPL